MSTIDNSFFSDVAQLLNEQLVSHDQLSDDVHKLRLSSGKQVVVKRVARQSQWAPGLPWTELVVTDLLAAEGGAVPLLLAFDTENGWMVTEYIDGKRLIDLTGHGGEGIVPFISLVRGLQRIEDILKTHQADLKPFAVAKTYDVNSMLHRVPHLLHPSAVDVWNRLLQLAPMIHTLGPFDINAKNILWSHNSESVWMFDMATIGKAPFEMRLAAYSQSVTPCATLLTEEVYHYYYRQHGLAALYRLLLFDFTFWATAIQHVLSAKAEPSAKPSQSILKAWGPLDQLLPQLIDAWARPRLPESLCNETKATDQLTDELFHDATSYKRLREDINTLAHGLLLQNKS